MSFMEPVAEYGSWWVLDTRSEGTVIMPADLVSEEELLENYPMSNRCGDGEVEVKEGWCARLSAPGYLDCTEWTGPYETEEEALEELKEMYGDDEDEESEEEENE